jgi:3-hydroxyacyl-CoA dehydrogenase/enoyl-CoA hydratase/3-hydroxybutyryl-CoA epimerase
MIPVRLERDANHVSWVIFDTPESKVNLMNYATMTALERILDELAKLKPKPSRVIFISAKPGTFIAGADIKEIDRIQGITHGEELSRAGQRILDKIEELKVPTIAAIDGACLGGGCELALACRFRVATDNPKTKIGLPETQLGIIPGWGGTQRLPRLVGLRAALDIIVPGKALDAVSALRIGLVDAVVPAPRLRDTAVWIAKRRPAPRSWWPGFLVRRIARKRTLARTRGQYPAPLKAIEVAGRGYDAEARAFGELAVTPQCRNLLHVHFLREKYSKLKVGNVEGRNVETVGVLGAGTMGAGIAMWCSARGLRVRLKDVSPELVAAGMKRIQAAYQEGVDKRKITVRDMNDGLERIQTGTDYTGFDECDLVVEAVLEDLEVKRAVFQELTPRLRPDCLIASNTSAIPIDDLAKATGRAAQFVGIHFFNPVHKMPLVEIVRGSSTRPDTLATAVEFAKRLRKIPIVVQGAPGFLVNRLLMPYLNEAGRLLGEGVRVEVIDRTMVEFGWPMGPARLMDEIGIDVALSVARELAAAYSDRMTVAPIFEELHAAGLKGRKGGAGFYLYDGKRERVNPRFAPAKPTLCSRGDIQERLMRAMVAEAKLCLEDAIVASEDDIDVATVFGCGFPAFRGGLVKWARDTGVW